MLPDPSVNLAVPPISALPYYCTAPACRRPWIDYGRIVPLRSCPYCAERVR
jgi:hypothetical protein